MTENTETSPQIVPELAGPLRRILAMSYDSLLLIAVLLLAMALITPLLGENSKPSHNPFVSSYLVSVTFFFFAWFWTHGGQTLGMRSWKLRLELEDGQPMTLWHALLRFLTAIPSWSLFGLGLFFCITPSTEHIPAAIKLLENLPCWVLMVAGFIWIVIDNWKNSWRDRFSQTRVIQLKKS
ncbi:MAG: RDD family protein [Gammaproteobacteria bacterium]|nr:RDD family protein [Gammaproteobacteria bacterium]